jgi:hypothetical protein
MVVACIDEEECTQVVLKQATYSLDSLIACVSREVTLSGCVEACGDYLRSETIEPDDPLHPEQEYAEGKRFTNDMTALLEDANDVYCNAGLETRVLVSEQKMIDIQTALGEILPNEVLYGLDEHERGELKISYRLLLSRERQYLEFEVGGGKKEIDAKKICLVDYAKLVEEGLFPVEEDKHLHIGVFLACYGLDSLEISSAIMDDGERVSATRGFVCLT